MIRTCPIGAETGFRGGMMVNARLVDSLALFRLAEQLRQDRIEVLGRLVSGDPELEPWIREHPDLIRPAPVATPRPHIPDWLRRQVYARDGHRCLACGRADRLSLDHIVPFSLGGADTEENLRTLCVPCNAKRGAPRGGTA